MSLFSKIWKGVKSVVLPAAGYALGGPIGGAIGGILGGGGGGGAPAVASGGSAASGTIMRLPAPARGGSMVTLPGAGTIRGGLGGLATGIATGAAGAAAGYYMASDGTVKRRRRRRRGITATELKNFRRVDQFLNKNFKCAPHRSYVRKSK